MHACLKIPEILHIIFEWTLDPASEHSSATLAKLARTCRSFNDTALDILWHTQTTLWPLIKLFPEEIWVEEPNERDPMAPMDVRFVRPPRPNEWSRFLIYSARIKCIIPFWFSYSNALLLDKRVHPSCYGILLRHRPSGHFFPNLRKFEWRQDPRDNANSVAHLLLMIHPKVSDISITIVDNLNADKGLIAQVKEALKDFCERCTYLEHFTFVCTAIPELWPLTSQIIIRHHSLRTVHTFQQSDSPLSCEAILHLAQLPTLERLSLRTNGIMNTGERLLSSLKAMDVAFPMLHHLMVCSDDLTSCNPLLDIIQSTHLQHLHILLISAPLASEVKEFTTIISQHRSRTLISAISLSSATSSPRNHTEYIITNDTLKPLLSLRNMREFRVVLCTPIKINNAFIDDLAQSWPDLRVLELGTEWRRSTGIPHLTVKGLLPLVQYCPRLFHLGLEFNTDVSDFNNRGSLEEQTRPGGGLINQNITVFNAAASSARFLEEEDIVKLAGFLSDVFPSLLSVRSSWMRRGPSVELDEDADDEDEYNKWKEIDEITREMARIRRQERNWKAKVAAHRMYVDAIKEEEEFTDLETE